MSLLNNEVDILRRVPLFSGIDGSKLKLLAYTSDAVTYHEGQVLFRKGDRGDAAYVIIRGDAEVSIATDAGDIPVAQLSDGDFVGEIAILCDIPRTATVTATSELKTLRISKDRFLELLSQFPEIAIEMTRTLADRLNKTTTELVAAQRQIANAAGAHG